MTPLPIELIELIVSKIDDPKVWYDLREVSLYYQKKDNCNINRLVYKYSMQGDLARIKCLHELFDISSMNIDHGVLWAYIEGNLELAKYFHQIGIKYSGYTMDWASYKGHLELVRYLHSIGADCTPAAMVWACENGHLEVVKFLHSISAPFSIIALYNADKNRHLEVVEYIHEIYSDLELMNYLNGTIGLPM